MMVVLTISVVPSRKLQAAKAPHVITMPRGPEDRTTTTVAASHGHVRDPPLKQSAPRQHEKTDQHGLSDREHRYGGGTLT